MKHVNVKSVDAYFNLPKAEREWHGWYLHPRSLPADFLEPNKDGWTQWSKEIREAYPIQGWIREWFLSYDNPLYRYTKRILRKLSEIKYSIKRFIKPCAPRFRKAWRRHQYKDISSAILEVNFALILDFWYEEVQDGSVDWSADNTHFEFYTWLKDAVKWIEIERKSIEFQTNLAHDRIDRTVKQTYNVRYKEVIRLEKLLSKGDQKILKQMIDYREKFWS